MWRLTKKQLSMTFILVAAAAAAGCRTHMPHSFTWPAGGDIQYTHAKPPEGGYYSNWDPYAVELEVYPTEEVNPVRTQHVMVATVKDKDGKTLPNRRVEWMIAEGSVGDIVEVDESGWRASRGYKVTNKYAVSHTNNFEHVLDMGNDDPSDDIQLTPGQTWAVITSPIEGTSHVTVYAPGIYDWSKHKVFVKKHWFDVAWQFPPPATNPVGTNHTFTTVVTKHSDGSPLSDYLVTYRITDGPAAVFESSGSDTATVRTGPNGEASVTIRQVSPAEGTNNVQIDIERPADTQCCKPGAHIATGYTSKTWLAPKIAITKDAPARALAGENFQYSIVVSNPSSITADNVRVTDQLPDGIQYVSSSPSASASGQNLSWSLGSLAGGASESISVTVHGTRTGTFTNCAEVTADMGLSDRDCAETIITSAELVLEKRCPAEVLICDPISYTIVVRNTGDGPATNVRVTDDLPDGLSTDDGRRSVQADVGTLEPGGSREMTFVARADRTGTFTNVARASGDGGLSAEADCTTVVRQPQLSVTKTGPSMRYIGRPAEYEITVTNTGDAPARDTVLTDRLPNNAEFVNASDGGRVEGGMLTWSLGTLDAGASKTVSLTLRATQPGTVRNEVTARAYCAEDAAQTEMEVQGVPAILLEVIDLEDPIEVGGGIVYEITVTNQGSAVGTNIQIVCELPPEQEYNSANGPTPATADGRTVTFAPLPSLAPKARATFRVMSTAVQVGDSRFAVEMTSDQTTSPVRETESTNIY